jgi:hypothetical protein
MLRGLYTHIQRPKIGYGLRVLSRRHYATTATKNPFNSLVRTLKIGPREYKYFSLSELKDSRFGEYFVWCFSAMHEIQFSLLLLFFQCFMANMHNFCYQFIDDGILCDL